MDLRFYVQTPTADLAYLSGTLSFGRSSCHGRTPLAYSIRQDVSADEIQVVIKSLLENRGRIGGDRDLAGEMRLESRLEFVEERCDEFDSVLTCGSQWPCSFLSIQKEYSPCAAFGIMNKTT
jgi:hypothetical protein